MASIREITGSIYGCYRLALKDNDALSQFNLTASGFWTSFSAMFLSLIVILLQKSIEFKLVAADVDYMQFIFLFGLAVIISWTCYLVAMGVLSKYLDFSEKFSTFAIVYNWSQLAIIAVWFVLAIIVTGILGPVAAGVIGLFFIGASYLYLWHILVVTLQMTSVVAAAMSFLEFLIAILIHQALLGLLVQAPLAQ